MKCPKCDKEISEDLRFCPGCGAKLDAASGEPAERRQAPRVRVMRGLPADSKSKWRLFVWILVSALIICALAAGYHYYRLGADYQSARLSLRTGMYSKCAEKADAVVSKRPKMTDAWLLLAQCRYEADDRDGALKALDDALNWNKDSAAIHSLLGMIYFQTEKYKESEKSLTEALKLDADDRQANQYLGFIRYREGRLEEAAPLLEKSLKGAGRLESIIINKTLGDIYFKLEKYENAAKFYNAALAGDMNNVDISTLLIETYLADNKFAEAKTEMDRILGVAPEDQHLTRMKSRVHYLAERVETIDYVMKRMECDQNFMMVYTEMDGLLNRLNTNAGAFMGRSLPEMTEMVDNSLRILECYRRLRPKTEYYYLMHTKCLSIAALMNDTVTMLDNYVRTGDENTDVSILASQLRNFKDKMESLMDTWNKEQEEMKLDEMMKQGAKLKEGSLTALDLGVDIDAATSSVDTPPAVPATATVQPPQN